MTVSVLSKIMQGKVHFQWKKSGNNIHVYAKTNPLRVHLSLGMIFLFPRRKHKVFLHEKANIVEKRSSRDGFLHKNGLFVEKLIILI